MRQFLILTMVIALTAMACSQSETDFEVEPADNGKGLVITGYTGTKTDVRIPAKIQGKPVKEIGENAFFGYSSLESIIIPNSVNSIGEFAFASTSIKNIKLPAKITTIGDMAFARTGLTNIKWPAKTTKIGEGMFFECNNLKSIIIPKGVTIIESEAFASCLSLKVVKFPSTLGLIEEYAFANCTALVNLIFSKGSAPPFSIQEFAFDGCSNLSPASRTALRERYYLGEIF